MFQITDIIDEAKSIAGFCDQTKLFRWISDAIALIGNKGVFDPYLGFLDICTDGQYVTLPREVETPLAVNIGGRPSLGRDMLFSFHLNGPGDRKGDCKWTWDDKGFVCTYRELLAPSKVVARLQRAEDANCQVILYGFDQKGYPVRQQRGGAWVDGWQVPTVFGYPVYDADAPSFSRITRIHKAVTTGVVELMTIDASGITGAFLGVFEPDETDPWYRRIQIGRKANWVRIAYRKTNPVVRSLYERVPLRSRLGFILSMQAVKAYSNLDIATAHTYEADAARLETEAQEVADPPTMAPIQVVDMGNNIASRVDWAIE